MNFKVKRFSKFTGVAVFAGLIITLVFSFVQTLPTKAHDVSLIDRTIEIVMGEFFYSIDGVEGGTVTLKVGETVALNFINEGAVLHDAHFGTGADLDDRLYDNNLLAPFDMLVLESGERAQITFTPTEPGEFELGCFQLGHYEAGMKVPFVVEG